jgi:hypothetical protein
MTNRVRVNIELGKKGKRVVAYAPDWPGWNRGGKTEEIALETFQQYRSRYRPVAERAGLVAEFDGQESAEIVERHEGTGSTDFWGISFAPSALDTSAMPPAVLERRLTLLWACWEFFDDVAARVSPNLKKGPRGGGRDRDAIVTHVLGNERDWAGGIGVDYPLDSILDPAGRKAYREAFVGALRAYNAEGRKAKTWELSFLLRHAAFHALDHAWEMEDKDLTGKDA